MFIWRTVYQVTATMKTPFKGRHGIDQHCRKHQKTKNSSGSLAPMVANMNQTMAAMVGNISSMGNALKRMHADTASPSNAKRQKTTSARRDVLSDETSGDESADLVDSSALPQVTRTQQEQAPPNNLRTFAPIATAHRCCACKFTSHVIHRARPLSNKINK